MLFTKHARFAFPALTLVLAAQACATATRTETTGAGGASSATSTSHTTSTGTMATSSSSTGAGGCTSAADCVGQTDACNEGACINGTCGKIPMNELGACDDGKFCTEFDTCQKGVCTGGSTKVCTTQTPCANSTCDMASDKCVDIPAPDGSPCDDGDPCTVSSSCVGGACTGGPQFDCSFLNTTCSVGVCDKVMGCVAMAVNDGTACDDGLFCTVQDVCTAGKCGGVPNNCAAPGNVCMIGQCDEVSKTCVAVPGNNGNPCDDGNDCTVGETCSNGQCLGGVPGNQGAACDDHDGCTSGTHCTNGVCGGAQSTITQCINADKCCPPGCGANDNDCVDLTGVFAQYASANRNVYIWKTPASCVDLTQYTTFCTSRGLQWWSPKSQPDAQQLVTFAYNLDNFHTWIQVYGSVTTNAGASMVGPYNVVVDGAGCVDSSASGWTAFRKWACSFCDPENEMNLSCCWDGASHVYDWFVCED